MLICPDHESYFNLSGSQTVVLIRARLAMAMAMAMTMAMAMAMANLGQIKITIACSGQINIMT